MMVFPSRILNIRVFPCQIHERRIPVLLLVTDEETFIHPWVEAMVDHVFKDKDTLIHYLISNYFNEV